MTVDPAEQHRWAFPFLVPGAVLGAALGMLVTVVAGIPFAPEGGVVLGLLAGWIVYRRRGARARVG